MSSLFQDGGCCGNNVAGTTKTKCKGCVCELLNQLANQSTSNICDLGQRQRLFLKQKGTSSLVSFEADPTVPTVFTLINFDPENCCAVFTYEDAGGLSPSPAAPVTRTFIEDCRSIAGIVCVNGTDTAAGI